MFTYVCSHDYNKPISMNFENFVSVEIFRFGEAVYGKMDSVLINSVSWKHKNLAFVDI